MEKLKLKMRASIRRWSKPIVLNTFAGHDVSLITGSHPYERINGDRMGGFPTEGRDIVIGNGVWLGSGAIILGPSRLEITP